MKPAPATRPGWTLVLPVKGGPQAKSRLGAGPRLATAIALDTVAAALDCPRVVRVLAVTADAITRRECSLLGAHVVGERLAGAGLNPAIRDGLAAAGPARNAVAVLLADLPALTPRDLAAALDAVTAALPADGCGFVPDAEGTGTVLLASPDGALVDPAFGPGSAAAHAARGAVRLDLALPGLRRDVDTPAELDEALELGVGPRTREAVASATASLMDRRGARA